MTKNNGWPGKPGVPLNPERDGWHWLIRINGQYPEVWEWASGPVGWCAEYGDKSIGAWCESEGDGRPKEIAKWYSYLGAVLTPDEVQNLRDDLASAERERAHQHGRADRNAAEHAREQAKREALQARVAELEGALKDAAASVKEWGAYASQYLQDKWDLPGEVARYIAIAEGKNDAALTGGKDE